MVENDRQAKAAQAALAADIVALGHGLDKWSMVFALLGGVGLFVAAHNHDGKSLLVFGIDLLLAVLQRYFAMRTELDAAIFRRWAEKWDFSAESTAEEDMAALDKALGKVSSDCRRSLAERVCGARNLLMRQVLCFVAQVLCFLAAFFIA